MTISEMAAAVVKALEDRKVVFPVSMRVEPRAGTYCPALYDVRAILSEQCIVDNTSPGPLTSVGLSLTRTGADGIEPRCNWIIHWDGSRDQEGYIALNNMKIYASKEHFYHLPVPEHTIHKRFLYIPERDIMYCPINKAGCSFIGATLADKDPEDAFKQRWDALPYLPRIMSRKDTGMYKFTVVRNPYSRLVSCFLDVIRGEHEEPGDRTRYFRRCLDLPVTGTIDFCQFVGRIEDKGFVWGQGAEHWLPQGEVALIGTINYSSIGRFEGLHDYLTSEIVPVLRERGDTRENIFRFQDSIPERVSGASTRFPEFYTCNDLRKRVYKLYEIDFDLFRYSSRLRLC